MSTGYFCCFKTYKKYAVFVVNCWKIASENSHACMLTICILCARRRCMIKAVKIILQNRVFHSFLRFFCCVFRKIEWKSINWKCKQWFLAKEMTCLLRIHYCMHACMLALNLVFEMEISRICPFKKDRFALKRNW